jgi:hypothetical protein
MEPGGSLLCSQEQPLVHIQSQINPVHTLILPLFLPHGDLLLSKSDGHFLLLLSYWRHYINRKWDEWTRAILWYSETTIHLYADFVPTSTHRIDLSTVTDIRNSSMLFSLAFIFEWTEVCTRNGAPLAVVALGLATATRLTSASECVHGPLISPSLAAQLHAG